MALKIKKWIPFLILIVLMLAVYWSGWGKYFTFENLKTHHQTMTHWVEHHQVLAPLLFCCCYIIATALSLPGGAILSITGGFLFPMPLSTLYVVTSATIGSMSLFLVVKTSFGVFLKEKAGPYLKKLEKGFKENSVSYLFFLRLVPLFPFWLVNIAPALLNMRLKTYTWVTFLGIIPGAYVFTQAGNGLSEIFASGSSFSVGNIFNTQIQLALLVLSLFALLPILIKKVMNHAR